MPTYVYECRDCGDGFEFFQSMHDEELSICPTCDGTLTRVMQAASIAPDLAPYRSIITGEEIRGRAAHRDHLVRHDCVEIGDNKTERMKKFERSEFWQKTQWHKEKGVPLPPQDVRDKWSRDDG